MHPLLNKLVLMVQSRWMNKITKNYETSKKMPFKKLGWIVHGGNNDGFTQDAIVNICCEERVCEKVHVA
jgi:hypothetical protein